MLNYVKTVLTKVSFSALLFEKEADILQYDVNPAHKKFVEANKESWDKVIAVNGAIEKWIVLPGVKKESPQHWGLFNFSKFTF